jgi:endonuclease III
MEPNLGTVADLLLANREDESWSWQWIGQDQPLSRKDANKFLLACILDYQMRVRRAWENARRLAEDALGDPEDLWGEIASVSLDEWNAKRTDYKLHWLAKGHERVRTIGARIATQYQGDARLIWDNQSIEAVLYRLNDLGVGPQISRMVVGALIDTGHLQGKGDVKVDIHVRRVLGRILRGEPYSTDEAGQVVDVTRIMNPDNPWLLDRPLYNLGRSFCKATSPACPKCFMNAACAFAGRAA